MFYLDDFLVIFMGMDKEVLYLGKHLRIEQGKFRVSMKAYVNAFLHE
jgi:hypothetical protein